MSIQWLSSGTRIDEGIQSALGLGTARVSLKSAQLLIEDIVTVAIKLSEALRHFLGRSVVVTGDATQERSRCRTYDAVRSKTDKWAT